MENNIKKRIVEREEVFAKCPHCDKEIVGSAEKQVLYNLGVHIKQKHIEDDE